MDKFVINGGKPLNGVINISGAKNAAVAILPATILAKGEYIIDNLPSISDITSTFEILKSLGAKISLIDRHTVKIDTTGTVLKPVSEDLAGKLRASYYFIGALLGRFGQAQVAMPGGCNFGGLRPIDLHIKGFEALGAIVDTEGGEVTARSSGLFGTTIYFDKVSVGATINVMLAAVGARGVTIIENAAKEPHIVDLANFLTLMGADIKGAGTDKIKIRGGITLHGCDYSLVPDQIEAGTYMVIAAATRGDLLIRNVIRKHLEPITAKLTECGAIVEPVDIEEHFTSENGEDSVNIIESIRVSATGRLRNSNIKTAVHPGFPTDMQPQFTTLLSLCEGLSLVTDTVWENRFKYVEQLTKMGAQIQVENKVAIVQGTNELKGACVVADDLRAGAAMIIAGLSAKGTTQIGNIIHIDRGYEDVVEKLSAVGADIQRVSFPDENRSEARLLS